MFWFVLAFLTCLAVVGVCAPFFSRASRVFGSETSAVEFYKNQLAEIERDAASGVLPAQEAEGSKAETGRRLLSAARAANAAAAMETAAPDKHLRRGALFGLAFFVVVSSAGLYAHYGSPRMPDEPITARLDSPASRTSIGALSLKLEQKLAENPEDGKLWGVAAQFYLQTNRIPEANRSFSEAARLNPKDPQLQTGYGITQMLLAGNLVTADARQAFERALALDPEEQTARFYLGLAAMQEGDKLRAKEIWEKLLKEAPPNSKEAAVLKQSLAELNEAPAGSAPALSPEAAPANAGPPNLPPEQMAKVQSMVDSLASRLKTQSGTPEEWMKLVRSYAILQERDKARASLADARNAIPAGTPEREQLDALARNFKLED